MSLAIATLTLAWCLLSSVSAHAQGGSRELTSEAVEGWRFCRLRYDKVRHEADGSGWQTDYPQADRNLMFRVSELTPIEVAFKGSPPFPDHRFVRGSDPSIYRCPFAIVSDAGTAGLTWPEVYGLRDWLRRGGFLWADDFWGPAAWDHWLMMLRRILPDERLIDIEPDHPLVAGLSVPQVPHVHWWQSHGGETSERGADSAEVHVRAIVDDHDRIMVLMTHNTDIQDTWEREQIPEFFREFSPDGYALGIRVLLHAMSH